MTNFKVGDYVRIVGNKSSDAGRTGMITFHYPSAYKGWRVVFGSYFSGRQVEYVEQASWLSVDELELLYRYSPDEKDNNE